jgi:asparagine synthase (glutamine-hydrolysing)
MCGITGILRTDGAPADRGLVERMTACIKHRGPDGAGLHMDREVGLGHRRLSIIDLEGGSQPIFNEDSTIAVVFNGEIYNFVELRQELEQCGHVFRTSSDTEVIVHGYEQWGTDCVRRFNGMFAFAVWDSRRRRLFLARDHLGVKPLYYARLPGQLLFASEIKALLASEAVARRVDTEALGELFTFRFVPAPRTLFDGIHKLPAGHLMVAEGGNLKIERFWDRIPRHLQDAREESLVEQYQALVQDAVRLQLRSDVPVGLFLSSGVDSGCLLAEMRRQSGGAIHTFTIGFEDGERTNETDDAREMARRFGSTHHEWIITAEDYLEYYDRYLWDLEEPVGNETAAAFYFVAKLAAREVKVALTGQGVDEPWAGYHRYLGLKMSDTYQRIPALIRRGLIRPLVNALPRNERLKRGVASLDEPDILTRFAKIYSFFTEDMRQSLFRGDRPELAVHQGYKARQAIARLQRDVTHLDPVSQMLYIDTRASLPDDLLMVSDKTSMANSIESRVPFLDWRIIEFIESLPLEFKIRGGTGKYLHKKAIEAWLPQEIVYRRKKGFANPVEKWLRDRMAAYVEDLLFDSTSGVRDFFDVGYIRTIMREHQAGRESYMRHIYLLISFEMWHRRFIRGS